MDIGPLVQAAATKHAVPLLGLVALGRAESDWTRDDSRRGPWPDWSESYGQITIGLARSYGIGDGTPASAQLVHDALMDRERSIDIMADYYAISIRHALELDPYLEGDEIALGGMCCYNGGLPRGSNWYWEDPRYAGNIQRYEEALSWAHSLIG